MLKRLKVMANNEHGSIIIGFLWMFFISILLFWIQVFGQFIAFSLTPRYFTVRLLVVRLVNSVICKFKMLKPGFFTNSVFVLLSHCELTILVKVSEQDLM